MRAGTLRETIVVQNFTELQDSYGEPIKTWGTYVTRRAAVEPMNGTEKWAGNERLSEATHRIRIRYDTTAKDITTEMRVSYDSRIFDITSVSNVTTRDREIHIMAVEKV